MNFYLIKFIIISGHHYLADIISNKYINNEMTTTRDINFNNIITKKFYAISQIVATTILLLHKNPDSSFTIMFPIQLSAFLMTLVRKKIISNNQWHIYYTLSLIFPYLLFNLNLIKSSTNMHLYTLLHIFLRLGLKTNKYLNMSIISGLFVYDNII
jgi:hypothetical protein